MTELIQPGVATGAPQRRPRADALPEYTSYRDAGCDLFTSCLTCPLPRCRYDVPGGARAMLNRVRDEEIRHARLELGLPVDEIARRFRVSRRTVFRILQQPQRSPPAREAAAGRSARSGSVSPNARNREK